MSTLHRKFPSLIAVIVMGVFTLTACGSSLPAGEGEPAGYTDSFAEKLAREDHRFLDTLDVTHSLLGQLAESHRSLPFTLGRALERRGRRVAAEEAYQFAYDAGSDPWAGLAAIRKAHIFSEREEWGAALAWAIRGTEEYPYHRDGWYLRGQSLYNMEEYAQLVALVGEIPDMDELTIGEEVSLRTLRDEIAVWLAVAQFTATPSVRQAILDAFLYVPAGDIHTRLYLYLYYRPGALERFTPVERRLLDGVYRVAQGERIEGLRLFEGIPPDDLIRYLRSASASAGASAGAAPGTPEFSAVAAPPVAAEMALPGLFATLDQALSVARPTTDAWLSRLSAQAVASGASSPESPDTGATLVERLAVLQGRASTTQDDPDRAQSVYRAILSERAGSADPLVREIRDRYLALYTADGSGDGLIPVLSDLIAFGATAEELQRAVDRLLPDLVRRRRFRTIEEALHLLTSSEGESTVTAAAAAQVSYVLAAAAESRLYTPRDSVDALLERTRSLSIDEFGGLAARVIAGTETDLAEVFPVDESRGNGGLPRSINGSQGRW